MFLTELQQDALRETVNVGVGYAASALSELVGSPVTLQVPELVVLTMGEAQDYVSGLGTGNKAAVRLAFSGALTGSIVLMFPLDAAVALVSLLAHDLDVNPDMDGLRAATLEETGNLILNGVVGSLSNMLHEQVAVSIPYYTEQPGFPERMVDAGAPVPAHVILARAQFNVEAREIRGEIFLFFETGSVDTLTTALDRAVSSLED